nr:unnamed protein product [Spirometra erinaceieuropaei]
MLGPLLAIGAAPVRRILDEAEQSYLHEQGVVHRDLTSHNCLVRSNGSVVVADLGLALLTRPPEVVHEAHDTHGFIKTTTPNCRCIGERRFFSECAIKEISSDEDVQPEYQVHPSLSPRCQRRNKRNYQVDRVSYLDKKEVVYKIPCEACDAVYCGQTGKSASTRIREQQLAVKRRDNLSQVAMHTLETVHAFAWNRTRIVGVCPFKKGRDFREAMHSDESCINRHIELDAAYKSLKGKWKRREPIRTG